jgi:chromosome partitioning protein
VSGILDLPLVKEVMAGIVTVVTFAYSCYRFGKQRGNATDKARITSLEANLSTLDKEHERITSRFVRLEKTIRDPRDFWLRSPKPEVLAAHQERQTKSIPIISVLNFKGGVGKTTICANLAAHFANRGKRVLMIDCDYQGSLSDTVLTHARVDSFVANAHWLIEGREQAEKLRGAAERLSSIDSRMWIYPAFYDYSRAEIQMMFRWLVGQDDEIRYNLSTYLQSPAFLPSAETGFDMVLIDAPPRLLTGVVNALTASTHVLVPTILDGQSHIATLNTIGAIRQFRQKLNPGLKLLGVVPSLVSTATGYNPREQIFIDELERQAAEHYDGPVQILKSRPIWRREELAKAGGSEIFIATDSNAQKSREIRDMFARVGEFIEDNVRWRSTGGEAAPAAPGQPKLRAAQ